MKRGTRAGRQDKRRGHLPLCSRRRACLSTDRPARIQSKKTRALLSLCPPALAPLSVKSLHARGVLTSSAKNTTTTKNTKKTMTTQTHSIQKTQTQTTKTKNKKKKKKAKNTKKNKN